MTDQLTDQAIQEIVESLILTADYCSVEEATVAVEEIAGQYDLISYRSGEFVYIAHFGLTVYDDQGTYRLRQLEVEEM